MKNDVFWHHNRLLKQNIKLVLTPLELIDRIAAVTAMTQVAQVVTSVVSSLAPQAAATEAPSDAVSGHGAGCVGTGVVGAPEPEAKPKPRSAAHDLWAALLARIYEVFPLTCARCAGAGRGCPGRAGWGHGKPIATRLPRRSAYRLVNVWWVLKLPPG